VSISHFFPSSFSGTGHKSTFAKMGAVKSMPTNPLLAPISGTADVDRDGKAPLVTSYVCLLAI
jgi:hypothetical protein